MTSKLISKARTKINPNYSHPLYRVWQSMVHRCTKPTSQAWENYGGRGIKVCKKWEGSFQNFVNDMEPTFKSGLTLDRKDNQKGYYKNNCWWATRIQQANNRRSNTIIKTPKGKMTVTMAARIFNMKITTLLYILKQKVPQESLFKKADVRNRFMTS